nr:uncharacterized protein LOC112019639 [Quercus suber]
MATKTSTYSPQDRLLNTHDGGEIIDTFSVTPKLQGSIDTVSYPLGNRLPDTLGRDEIIEALSAAPKLQKSTDKAIVRISESLVVKYGLEVQLWEAMNMKFASSIPGVRAPTIHDAWQAEVDDPKDSRHVITYILMDFIPGDLLGDVWSSMDVDARDMVCCQIRDMLKALQCPSLTEPGPVGGGLSRGFYFTQYDAGPFESRDDIEDWFNGRLQVCKDFGRALKNAPDFTGKFNNLAMCHLDLHTHNIILDSRSQVWIIDWEAAGAYPVFFEEAFLKKTKDRDHPDFIKYLLRTVSTGEYNVDIKELDVIGFAVTTGAFCKPSR